MVKLATPLHPSPDRPSAFACKIMPKKGGALLDEGKFQEEVAVLRAIDHPNILRLYEVYETTDTIYLITQLCEGGELFDRIIQRGVFSEGEAAVLIAQLLDALTYLHSRGIVHRDVKPENVLIERSDPHHLHTPQPSILSPTPLYDHLFLADFGMATNTLTKPRALRASSQLGSVGYMAPEVFSGLPYTEACDVWSVGVILYILLAGIPPFIEDPVGREGLGDPFWLYVNQMTEQPSLPLSLEGKRWEGRSEEVKALLKGMLEVDPSCRLRAADAMEMGWVREGRERWEAVRGWRRAGGKRGAGVGGGEVMGWSVRERGKSKGNAGQMQTMAEVMREIQMRMGTEEDNGVAGEMNGEAQGGPSGEETKEEEELGAKAVTQKRVKMSKAMSVMDTRALMGHNR